ncbi:outer membrane liproprotein [Campylobacter peloridis]|uniref:Outer membrane liproprotein n=1 Tax=Campylobacter peloridis TaxID=488546 RepID=A0ABX6TT27_9BACT|nr:outer membrane lipoprotein MapA [Campylobacter peloridis]AJC85065.1 outer membrane liproprotein [Campylobacter peloridis LMG 23910]QOQ89097.1 outer membrane liproprotein [Campylobacter peloridis]
MIKKILLLFLVLFFSACAINSKNQGVARVNEVIKIQAQCYNPSDSKAYEAKIQGLRYISDVGLKYCSNKRTIDKSASLKKVYIHRIYDLNENLKYSSSNGKNYYINENFNYYFYVFLKEELENRGIIVVDDTQNSPYILRVDLSFNDFYSKFDSNSLFSIVASQLELKDINTNKRVNIKTKQEVQGFNKITDLPFYTQLLIKQVANKAADIISSL